MGKKPFVKGDWTYGKRSERFKHAKRLGDQKALRKLKHIRKHEQPSESANLDKSTEYSETFEDILVIPKALQHAEHSSDRGSEQPQLRETTTEQMGAVSESSTLPPTSANYTRDESSSRVSEEKAEACRPKGSKLRCGRDDHVTLKFKKEIQIAEQKKRNLEMEREKHEHEMRRRSQLFKKQRQDRCETFKAFTDKTRRGQPKMGSVISGLIKKIERSANAVQS